MATFNFASRCKKKLEQLNIVTTDSEESAKICALLRFHYRKTKIEWDAIGYSELDILTMWGEYCFCKTIFGEIKKDD